MPIDTYDDTDAPPEDRVEIPDPEPLPEIERTSGPGPGGQGEVQEHAGGDGPPPLPPLLETGASTLASAGSGIYAATGVAGLMAAAGVVTVAGVAYGVSRARATRARAAAGSRAGAAGAGRAGRGGRFFGVGGGGLAGRTARGAAGRGLGRAGAGAGSRAGAGRGAAGARHRAGAGGLGRGSSPAGRRGSGSSRGGSSRGRSGSGSLFGGGGSSFAGRRGSGSSRGGSGGGLFGGGGSSRGRPRSGRGGSGGGGLFGLGAGSTARTGRRRFGRSTSIIDPATGRSRAGAARGRLRRGLRAGWTHPRVRRARAITRRGWSRGRLRVRSHAQRLSSYLRKRKWALKMRGWGRGFADWFGGLWASLIGRARDPRYGPMRGWQLGIAAAAIGALGAGPKKAQPRPPLVGRVIGTAAPVPGDGPLVMAGRTILALTTGEDKEPPLAAEVQRVRDAAQEMQDALAALGGSSVGMLAYEQGLKELGPTLAAIADGVKTMATVAEDEQPLDSSVLEFFSTIEDAARGAAEVAEELPGLFRAAHEIELERLENPRVNEQRWDVSRQDD